MASYLWNTQPQPHFDINGLKASGAKAYFYLADTSTPLTVYQDYARTTPHPFPIVADYNGVFTTPIYLDFVDYRIRVTTANGDQIYDFLHCPNPAPVSASSVVTVTPTQLWKTGYTVFMLQDGSIDGFVRLNGKTIGNASSGATERQNDDTEPLYTLTWNTMDDTRAPVIGGRGSSAGADFIAGKPIRLSSMQGVVPVGMDTMGAAAGGIIQKITTCSTTYNSPTIVVDSASGIGRGMYVVIDGAEIGLVVLSISGTTVTLNSNYLGSTGSGKIVRFSYFPNAEVPGVQCGSHSWTPTLAELPAHTHGVTDPGHLHSMSFSALGAVGSAALAPNSPGTNVNTASATTGVTVNYAGGGLPNPLMQPSITGTWYVKL